MKENCFAGAKAEQVAYFSPYKGHIHNPGMGIISMAVSDHMVTGYTPEERAANDAKKPFELTREMLKEITEIPYIDNLYIRAGWNDVQKERGKLQLKPEFEMAVEAAREAGLSWGLRIMQCSPSNPDEHLVPEFLADRLPMFPYYGWCDYGPQPRKFPLYTDDYLKYWNEMLMMLGEKYDGDPALEYADVSGFGLWGEGHHGAAVVPRGPIVDIETGSKERMEEVVGCLIDGHRRAFHRTPMVLNLVLSQYKAGRQAIESGCWVRRDSYYHWFTAAEAEYGLQRRGDAAMIFETVMPGILKEDSEDPAFRKSYWRTPDQMCDYGAAYGVVGFNPKDTLFADHMMPELFDVYKNRLGYRLRPSVIWKLERENGSRSLALGIVNDGSANPPGTVCFFAESNGEVRTAEINGAVFDGRMHIAEVPLPASAEEEVTLSMSLKIGDKIKPARFAADVRRAEAPYRLRIRLSHH